MKSGTNRNAGPAAAGVFLLVLGILAGRATHAAPVPKGTALPAFSLKSLSGERFDEDRLRGKVSLLCFFSTTNDLYKDYLNAIDRYGSRYEEQGLKVLGVSVDPTMEETRKKTGPLKVGVPILADLDLALSGALNVLETPTTFLVGPEGKIGASWVGFDAKSKSAFEADLEGALKREGIIAGGPDASDAGEEVDGRWKKKILVSNNPIGHDFSSDGEKILYVTTDNNLWLYNVESDARTQIASGVKEASWSPDNRRVVYSKFQTDGIFLQNASKGSAERLSQTGHSPVWSPGGQFIAYRAAQSEIWIYDFKSKKNWRLSADGVKAEWLSGRDLILVTDAKSRSWLISPLAKYSLLKRFQ